MVFDTDNGWTSSGIVLSVGSSSTTQNMYFRPTSGGGQARLEMKIFNTGSVNNAHVQCDLGMTIAEANALVGHVMWNVVQDGLGGDVKHYFNGVLQTNNFTAYAGALDETAWFADKQVQGRVGIGTHTAFLNVLLEAHIARVCIAPVAYTAEQISALQAKRSAPTTDNP
jgi:hypothetical protein